MNNDGGMAFPPFEVVREKDAYGTKKTQGVTLRDYFAAQAMAALASNTGAVSAIGRQAKEDGERDGIGLLVSIAYKHADAMLAERDK